VKLSRPKIAGLTAAFAVILGIVAHCTGVSPTSPRGISSPVFSTVGLRRTIDVTAYGAKGDGSTDDRVSITSAMSAACAAGATDLFFPPGVYIVSRNGSSAFSIDMSCGDIAWTGIRDRSIIKQPTGMPDAAVPIIRVDAKKNVTFSGLVLDGNWGNCVTRVTSASNGVALNGAGTINVDDASCFPAGTFFAVITDTAGTEFLSCTGKTGTTLTGCTASGTLGGSAIGTLFTDQRIGYVISQAGINHSTQAPTGHTTTIASGSNGAVLPQATINVVSTTGFAFQSGETLWIRTSLGYQLVTCTGTSGGTQFTGCSGGIGTLTTGNEVYNGTTNASNHGIMVRGSQNVLIENVRMRQIYGDCMWIGAASTSAVGNHSRNIRVKNVNCEIVARNGISLIGTEDVVIDGFYTLNVKAQAIDAEPVNIHNRAVFVTNSVLDTWFEKEITHGGNPLSIVGGKNLATASGSDSARGWRVTGNLIRGTVYIEKTTDVVFSNNRVVLDYGTPIDGDPDLAGGAGVLAEMGNNHLEITGNYIYSRPSSSGAEGGADTAALAIWTYQSGSLRIEPSNVIIANNKIEARNARSAIMVKGAGGAISGDSGTSTAIDNVTLTDSTKSWTTNQWQGFMVQTGSVIGTVASNTATALTLNRFTIGTSGACTTTVGATCSAAWLDGLGNQATTPPTGTYQIYRQTGVIDIFNNELDLTEDGRGKGKWGVNITNGPNNATGMRVRVRSNKIRNCDTYAIRLRFDGTTPYPLLEVTDNFAWDDLPTHTCTNLLRFENAILATKFIMSGNVKGEGVTNMQSGLSAGTWLVRDGLVQAWAGYGSPEGVVTAPAGSTYQRLDGGIGISHYTKDTGSSSTGWKDRGTLSILSTIGHHTTTGTSPGVTSCGTGASIVGDDYAGTVTEGTGASGCTLTFGTTYTTRPSCQLYNEDNLGFTSAATATTLTITNVGALSSKRIDYVCFGH